MTHDNKKTKPETIKPILLINKIFELGIKKRIEIAKIKIEYIDVNSIM